MKLYVAVMTSQILLSQRQLAFERLFFELQPCVSGVVHFEKPSWAIHGEPGKHRSHDKEVIKASLSHNVCVSSENGHTTRCFLAFDNARFASFDSFMRRRI